MAGLNAGNFGLKMNSPYFGQSYGGDMLDLPKKASALQTLSTLAPGIGSISTGIGTIINAVGAGIQGGKEEEIAKQNAEREDRKLDMAEKGMNFDQLNAERSSGLEGLKYLAGIRSGAIQSRNRSLFKNDLMRVLGR